MTISDSCKIISQKLAHNLRLANTDAERIEYISYALKNVGEKVIPPLNILFNERSEGDAELEIARKAALELTSLICIDLNRNCANFRSGISCLEELAAKCTEPQMKSKIVFYTNQLKKRWNISEPGGFSFNPRAKRIRPEISSKSPIANVLGVVLLFGVALFLFSHPEWVAQFFMPRNKPVLLESTSRVQSNDQQGQTVQKSPIISPQIPTGVVSGSSDLVAGDFFTFTDKQGVAHIVNDPAKVPQEYQQNMKVTRSSSYRSNSTPVLIENNQVIVPVIITFRGRSIETNLLLDTGASLTSISESVASRLGVGTENVRTGKSTIADGRSVGTYLFKADSLAVTDHILPQAETVILPGCGGKGYEGLLGMNYLKNFRYHVNFGRSVIEW